MIDPDFNFVQLWEEVGVNASIRFSTDFRNSIKLDLATKNLDTRKVRWVQSLIVPACLDDLVDVWKGLVDKMASYRVASTLALDYFAQNIDGTIGKNLGIKRFPANDALLEAYVKKMLEMWYGHREPYGVDRALQNERCK